MLDNYIGQASLGLSRVSSYIKMPRSVSFDMVFTLNPYILDFSESKDLKFFLDMSEKVMVDYIYIYI